VTPELVPRRWWEYLLHNKTALYIRTGFVFKLGRSGTETTACWARGFLLGVVGF
jgi:hypothetical protein